MLMREAGFSDGRMPPYSINGTAMFWLIQLARWAALSSDVASCPGGVAALEAAFPPLKFDDAAREDPARAALVWALMSAPGGVPRIQAGFERIFNGGGAPSAFPRWYSRGPHHSDAVVAIDAAGNACAMAHSINSAPFGTGLFAQGVALSSAALVQLAPLAATPRGGRLAGPVAPLLVRRAAAAGAAASTAAVSTVGASLHEVTLQILNLHLDFGLPANLSVLVPKFLLAVVANASSSGAYPAAELVPAGAFAPAVVDAVAHLGQPVVLGAVDLALANMGFPAIAAADAHMRLQGYSTEWLNGYSGTVVNS